MKKILSTLLVAAMLLSLVIVASVPAAAADGMWLAYATASDYALSDSERSSIPGYEYTDDGVRLIPADWEGQAPFATIQTRDTWNIQDGIYMQVRIDEFSYEAADKWVNFNIWSQPMTEPGVADAETYGYGVQTLFRPEIDDKEAGTYKIVFNGKDSYTYYKEGFTRVPYTDEEKAINNDIKIEAKQDENGCITIEFSLTYDGENYTLLCNGAPVPAEINEYLKEAFPDGQAYVGFSMRNSEQGGTVGCTVTSFGANLDEATVPAGDDSREPVKYVNEVAEIASADTVPAGQPAIILTGDMINSATGKAPSSTAGTTVKVNDDFTVHLVETKQNVASVYLKVKNNVSYSVEDFPVAVVLTKNFCTCDYMDECYATESVDCYVLNGKNITAGENCRVRELEMCYDPIIVEDGDKAGQYLYFYTDMVEDIIGQEGRINGIQYGFANVKYTEAGRNAFDIEFVAYFRTVEEAEEYVYDYLGLENPNDYGDDEDDTTEEPDVVVTTEEPDVNVTTEAPKGGDDDKQPAKSGCGSVVGTSVVAIVAVAAACGFVAFKKKED